MKGREKTNEINKQVIITIKKCVIEFIKISYA